VDTIELEIHHLPEHSMEIRSREMEGDKYK
jgi:hypothetical protein